MPLLVWQCHAGHTTLRLNPYQCGFGSVGLVLSQPTQGQSWAVATGREHNGIAVRLAADIRHGYNIRPMATVAFDFASIATTGLSNADLEFATLENQTSTESRGTLSRANPSVVQFHIGALPEGQSDAIRLPHGLV